MKRARQMSLAPSAAYQSESVYCSLAQRPSERTSAAATTAPMTTRRVLTSDGHALLTQPRLHLSLDLGEARFRARLEAGDENGLRVRRADETPPVAEQHANTVDVDDLVPAAEVRHGALDDRELHVVAAIDADLGGADELRNVRKQLLDRAPGIGDDAQQACGAVQRVVVAVVALAEEHVARHLAGQRCP